MNIDYAHDRQDRIGRAGEACYLAATLGVCHGSHRVVQIAFGNQSTERCRGQIHLAHWVLRCGSSLARHPELVRVVQGRHMRVHTGQRRSHRLKW